MAKRCVFRMVREDVAKLVAIMESASPGDMRISYQEVETYFDEMSRHR